MGTPRPREGEMCVPVLTAHAGMCQGWNPAPQGCFHTATQGGPRPHRVPCPGGYRIWDSEVGKGDQDSGQSLQEAERSWQGLGHTSSAADRGGDNVRSQRAGTWHLSGVARACKNQQIMENVGVGACRPLGMTAGWFWLQITTGQGPWHLRGKPGGGRGSLPSAAHARCPSIGSRHVSLPASPEVPRQQAQQSQLAV